MLIVAYENRAKSIVGLKLLVLSLAKHCKNWPIHIRYPEPPGELRRWLASFSEVTLCEDPIQLDGAGYNIKPTLLLEALTSGARSCCWLDTDLLIKGNIDFLEDISDEELVVTQEPWETPDGSTLRSSTWGLEPGRQLPGPLNSAVIRVTNAHRELLQAWSELLRNAFYQKEQSRPSGQQHPHMISDQDALSALLASDHFSTVPVRRLKHPSEILQHHGAHAYGPRRRFEVLRSGMPPILHAMGASKPWTVEDLPYHGARMWWERLFQELSPYTHIARGYKPLLDPNERQWLERQTIAGNVCRWISRDNDALRGFTHAMIYSTLQQTKRACKLALHGR